MNDRQRNREERGGRVEVYMDAAAEEFPAGSKGAALTARLKELRAEVAALELERAAHKSKRRQGTEGRDKARTTLNQMVKTAWDTYKSITLDHPDVKGIFESPSKIKNDQSLVTAARRYADAAAPLAGLFTEFDLPPAFFNDMKAAADSLESYTTIQNEGVGAGVGSTAAVEAALKEMDEVVERLDTVVRNKCRDDPARLAAWESTSRVERAARRKPEGNRPEGNEPPPPPPPANG
jgi:hypothetical protein